MPKKLMTAQLLAIRPDMYHYIATRLPVVVTRQHVRRTARQMDGLEPGKPSARIEKALRMAIARRRYP